MIDLMVDEGLPAGARDITAADGPGILPPGKKGRFGGIRPGPGRSAGRNGPPNGPATRPGKDRISHSFRAPAAAYYYDSASGRAAQVPAQRTAGRPRRIGRAPDCYRIWNSRPAGCYRIWNSRPADPPGRLADSAWWLSAGPRETGWPAPYSSRPNGIRVADRFRPAVSPWRGADPIGRAPSVLAPRPPRPERKWVHPGPAREGGGPSGRIYRDRSPF